MDTITLIVNASRVISPHDATRLPREQTTMTLLIIVYRHMKYWYRYSRLTNSIGIGPSWHMESGRWPSRRPLLLSHETTIRHETPGILSVRLEGEECTQDTTASSSPQLNYPAGDSCHPHCFSSKGHSLLTVITGQIPLCSHSSWLLWIASLCVETIAYGSRKELVTKDAPLLQVHSPSSWLWL